MKRDEKAQTSSFTKHKFRQTQFVSERGKKILIVRKKHSQTIGKADEKKERSIFVCPNQIKDFIKSKNKSFGLEYFTPFSGK